MRARDVQRHFKRIILYDSHIIIIIPSSRDTIIYSIRRPRAEIIASEWEPTLQTAFKCVFFWILLKCVGQSPVWASVI